MGYSELKEVVDLNIFKIQNNSKKKTLINSVFIRFKRLNKTYFFSLVSILSKSLKLDFKLIKDLIEVLDFNSKSLI